METYRVTGLPTTYFIDKNGVLRSIYRGPLTEDRLRESVAERTTEASYAERQLAALQKADKGVRRSASLIPTSTAATLERLWSAMLSQARLPAEPPRCIDGTSYFLFELTEGVRRRGGWGRCPQKDTPPAAGLQILEELCSAGSSARTGQLTAKIAQLQRSLR